MRGGTNAVQSNLPRNGTDYFNIVFGSNSYAGDWYATLMMPNADKVNITLNGMGVLGQSWWAGSELASKVSMTPYAWGLVFRCNDASVAGTTCNPQISIVGGGLRLSLARLVHFFRRC